jgi:hypothetical protein
MPFAVNTPGGQVQLLDLPLEVLEQLEDDTGRRWSQLLTAPGWNAKSIRLIYAAACAQTGCDPKPLTPRDLLGDGDDTVIVEVPDDLPTSYTDGMPDPKAEAETPTPG